MYSNEPHLVPVEGYCIFETLKAIKAILDVNGRKIQTWVPKKVCEDWPDVGDSGEFLVEDWWLGEKGII